MQTDSRPAGYFHAARARTASAFILLLALVFLFPVSKTNAQAVPDGVKITRDIVYVQREGGHSLQLDLYLPAGPAGPHPLALWMHGGNLHQSRHYSQFLALQLKARQEGIPTPVYGLQEVHHKA